MTLTTTSNVMELLSKSSVTLDEVLDAIADAQEKPKPAAHRDLPPMPTFSDAERKALRTIVKNASEFPFPEQARILTEEERKQAIDIFVQIKTAKSSLANLEEAFKTTFHGHLDVELEAAKRAKGVEQDVRGNYIADGEITASGVDKKVARETRGGGAAGLTMGDLTRLVEDERFPDWDHKAFLAATEQTRNVDTASIMEMIKKTPKLVDGLRSVVHLTSKTTQLAVRPVKTATAKK